MRGAYGEVGREDFGAGEPSPDMPDTLYLLLADVRAFGLVGGCMLLRFCRFDAEFEVVSIGGVVPPYNEFKVDEDFVVGLQFSIE